MLEKKEKEKKTIFRNDVICLYDKRMSHKIRKVRNIRNSSRINYWEFSYRIINTSVSTLSRKAIRNSVSKIIVKWKMYCA